MSQRAKRPNRSDDGSVPVKRRKRTAAEEEEAASLAAAAWQPRSNDLKSIYNRTTTEAPAELFRKDLISAMKLPDSEPLALHEYWVIVDQWKQEWERGVQVPVNPDSLPEPSVTVTHCTPVKHHTEFKLPKTKYIRITNDDNFKNEEHQLSSAPAQSEAACSYDLDECDIAWLKIMNAERAMCGQSPIHEDHLERVIEQFELSCWDKIQSILRNEEGLGIEYDENVICDVCRSPDSEEGNEMVFCDSCNICVHQACYGITRIPEGQWLCCTCNLGKRPKCVLCPNKGGAMKSTRSGQKWAHVSCALWIPEVSIGCVEKMEPITKISSIPQSRWALICVLCRERVGSCIQCSVKTCKTAYHVTCAFKHGLEMRAIIEDENADDGVKLRSYCEKHSKSSKKEKSVCSGSEDDDSKRKKRKDMTSEEKNQARAARLQEIEAEFFKHVSIKDVTLHLNIDNDSLHYIYNYWKLKRKAGSNKPLLPPKSEDVDMLSQKREQADLEKMKMFVQLRQDLERVRNLCYMVSRREKLSRSFFRLREQTFHKQTAVLESAGNLPNLVFQAVCEANHGPSIYDRLYSHDNVEEHKDFDNILARIAGSGDSSDEKKPEINGLFKDIKNPYKKVYFNGTSKRRSGSLYGSSSTASAASSSDEKPKVNRLHPSSTDDEKPSPTTKKKIKNRKVNNNNNNKSSAAEAQRRRKRHSSSAHSKIDSTSDDEEEKTKNTKKWPGYSKSRLKQVERELGYSASDSDELIPIHHHSDTQKIETKTQMSSIYSDSDSSDASIKNTDSQLNKLRTKAAVKEFSHKPSTSKQNLENKKKTTKVEPITNTTTTITSPSKKETSAKLKKDYVPSDLIVPQRQAAKKATENLKSTTTSRAIKETTASVEETSPSAITASQPNKLDDKLKKEKLKTKLSKETALLGTAIKRDGKREREENKKERDDTKREKEDVRKEKDDTKKERDDGKEKSGGTGDVFDIEKEMDKLESQEILAYVPQRQAAKKAAEHIKSGLGKAPLSIVPEPPVEVEKPKPKEVKKEVEPRTRRKSSSQSSSSSSTSSSSDSSSSSSSESEDEPSSPPPPTASAPKSQATAATATVQQKLVAPPRSESREQSSTKRTNAQDWPFLDKVTKPAASSSSESSSDSSRSPSPIKPATAKQQTPIAATITPSSKSPDKKLQQQSTPTSSSSSSQREESARCQQRGKGRHTAARGRLSRSSSKSGGDVDVRPRNLSDSQRGDVERERNISKSTSSRKGKPDEVVEKKREKSPAKLLSPIRKADKKLNDFKDVQTNLEKEILERKAGKQGGMAAKTKSTLDRLFGNSDKKIDKLNNKIKPVKNEKVKSTVKENKEPLVIEKVLSTKKSPVKSNKNIDEIFAERIISTNENKVEVKEKQNKQLYELEEMVVHVVAKPEEIPVIEEPKITEEKLLDLDTISEKVSKTQENNRSIFSPTHLKDNLLDDFDDNLDGFGISKEEEIMKGPLTFTFGNSTIFKEDSKEDSARETLNLVEKLRLELSKKSTSCDVDDSVSVSSSTKNDNIEFTEQVVPPSVTSTMMTESPLIVQPEVIEQPTEHSSPPLPPKDFHYCDADVTLLEQNKNIPIEEHHTHGISSQGDERWVPPSDSYLNIEATNYTSNDQHYHLQQYSSNNQTHHNNSSKDVTIGKVPPSPPLSRISQTPLNETGSMDCMPDCIQSPYSDVHPQAKWADSEIMPNRRSSSSSAASTSSSCSRRNDDDDLLLKRQDVMMVNHPVLDNLSYLPQGLPFAPESFPPFSESSQFAPPPVSLFPPPSSLAFTSTAPTMFPPAFGAPFPTPHSVISSLPKTVTETVPYSNVAFTASQHNLALTAAMVNLPKELEEQQEEEPQQLPVLTVEPPLPPPQPASSPIISNNSINQLSSPSPSVKSNNSSVGKKSPSKPTRSSTRVTNKSPGKSPAAPPSLQESVSKNIGRSRDARKNSIKSTASTGRGGQTQMRGRGRGRGRGRPPPLQHNDYDLIGTNTIHNKLVGTVYDLDFDDENSNDNMTDLKSMRERRKSTDLHDRKNDIFIKDSIDSPKNRSYNADLRDLRPPTPIEELAKIDEISGKAIFSDIVEPVLPGPVDMRTYSGGFEQQPYNERNLLQAFATGTTETQVHEEIDEDFEKELQTALTPVAKKVDEPATPGLANIKVSLSDARNQLKVKIKGPIANYSAPLPTPIVDPVQASIVSNNSIMSSNNSVSSGTTNLRRMRKKELLRQYWTQDMNMDDNSSCATPGFNTTAPTVPHVNRTIITIPKAVASMTSIPTKEDYRDYRTGEDIEPPPKIAKTKSRPGALSRELKQLDLALDENGGVLERRRSSIDASKRRGRPPRLPVTAPKIKIKIGNSVVGGPSGTPKVVIDRIRPPKKRLHNLSNKPSVEDLKRESMKFRKLVMADFGGIKEKRKKKDKSEKRKRKKAKAAQMQIITNEGGQNSTKLIIRIGKKSSDSEKDKVVNVEKATPIKLKLARCQEGSGYVMKQSPGTETKEEKSVQPGQPPPPPPPPAHSPPPSVSVPEPPPLKKDCEVR